MPKAGEAVYDITARDAGMVSALTGAERKAQQTGGVFEKTLSGGVDKGMLGAEQSIVRRSSRWGGLISGPLNTISTGFDSLGRRFSSSKLGGVFDSLSSGADRAGRSVDSLHPKAGRLGAVFAKLRGQTGDVAKGLLGLIGVAGPLGVAGVFVGIAAAGMKAISAASDLNETVSKVGVVFGSTAPEILKWGENAATALGMSKNEALGAAGTLGNLFVSMGLAQTKAGTMSTTMVQLASDMASFNNTGTPEALDAIRSGLVGETEPLRRFGVNLNEATLSQKAMDMGLVSSTKGTLPAAIRAQAAYAIILEQTKTAQGDFARTSSGLANQQRIAGARIEEAFARAGQKILPFAAQVLPVLVDAFTNVIEIVGVLFQVFEKLIGVVVFVGETIRNVFGGIADVIRGLVTTMIGTIRNLVDVAAQVPGPWQEAAGQLRDSLQQMQNDVDRWGIETKRTVKDDTEGIPPAVAGALAAGAPAVGAGAQTGLSDPILDVVGGTAGVVKAEAAKTPHEIAKSLRDGQFDVSAAAKAIHDAQVHVLSRTKEIAKIQGFLTGSALAKALRDKRPEVRAEAEAWRDDAKDRLFALQHDVPGIARRTGVSYAQALAAEKAKVKAAAEGHRIAASSEYQYLQNHAAAYGAAAGEAYARGLRSAKKEITDAASNALAGARGVMRALSPPGPESPLHDIDKWGARTGQTYADALASQGDYLRGRVEEFLSAAGFPGPQVSFAGSFGQSVRVDVRHSFDPATVRAFRASGFDDKRIAAEANRAALDATGLVRHLQQFRATDR